jgi:pilus assembly protein Flp/PilA
MFVITFLSSLLDARATREEKGASMVEYALLVAGMAAVVVAAVALIGGKITTFINGITF